MKLAITDQFLWDIFNAMSRVEDGFRFLVHPPRTWGDVFYDADDPIYQKYHKTLNSRKFSRLIYYLKKNNFIKVKTLQGKEGIIITRKGFSKVLQASFKMQDKKKRDDGKWIMLIFDLPRRHEKARRLLRSLLENLGYRLLQHSVWVCPFDVLEKTEILLQKYSLDQHIKIFLIEEL